MIELISGLPDEIVGIEAVGEVESADYKTVLIPAVEAALARHDKIRLLYVLGDRFEGYSGGAMWEDTKVGFEHIRKWEKFAVVTDTNWVRHAVKAFGWMIPGELRVFAVADRTDAEAWVTS